MGLGNNAWKEKLRGSPSPAILSCFFLYVSISFSRSPRMDRIEFLFVVGKGGVRVLEGRHRRRWATLSSILTALKSEKSDSGVSVLLRGLFSFSLSLSLCLRQKMFPNGNEKKRFCPKRTWPARCRISRLTWHYLLSTFLSARDYASLPY